MSSHAAPSFSSLPYHILPNVLSYLTDSLDEYLSLACVNSVWRAAIQSDDLAFRDVLIRCIIESRWFSSSVPVQIVPDGVLGANGLDTSLPHAGNFPFPLLHAAPAPADAAHGPLPTPLPSADATEFNSIASPTTALSPSVSVEALDGLRAELQSALLNPELFDFEEFSGTLLM